jgi:hypothetical protein
VKKWSAPVAILDLSVGSLSVEDAHDSMFTPEFQRFEILKPDDNSIRLLEELMGSDVAPRTKFIFENVDFSTISE